MPAGPPGCGGLLPRKSFHAAPRARRRDRHAASSTPESSVTSIPRHGLTARAAHRRHSFGTTPSGITLATAARAYRQTTPGAISMRTSLSSTSLSVPNSPAVVMTLDPGYELLLDRLDLALPPALRAHQEEHHQQEQQRKDQGTGLHCNGSLPAHPGLVRNVRDADLTEEAAPHPRRGRSVCAC